MNFIRREKDKLYDGDKEFRFISFNIPDALYSSHETIGITFPTPQYEQEDLIEGLSQLGLTVARLYCLSIGGEGVDIPSWNCFIQSDGSYNEDYFIALDRLLYICRNKGVRVIFPFVDRYKFIGGVADYAARRGGVDDQFSDDFYSNPLVIQDFKKVIFDVLNHRNVFTGVLYKEDPTILCWETGNELWHQSLYDDWAEDISAYIKSIDKNHLVMDGFYDVREKAISDDNIDIVSHHMYPFHAENFIVEFEKQYALAKGKKPYVIGEFSFKPIVEIEPFLDHVIKSDSSGALIWSMRQHSAYGGIRHHRENETYQTYHYPGFDQNVLYEEKETVALIARKNQEITKRKSLDFKFPQAPFLLPIVDPLNIRFLGATGADRYILERMTHFNEGFTVIDENVNEGAPESDFYCGDGDSPDVSYYRVKAVKGDKISGPSNIQKFERRR